MWQDIKEGKIIESPKDPDKPEGKKIKYKIIKVDQERGLTAYQKVYEKETENPVDDQLEEKK